MKKSDLIEIWKPVVYKGIDYTGRFEVSNLGRIRSLYFNPPRIRNVRLSNAGYCECDFPRPDGKFNYTTVHRLVKMIFDLVPNMDHLEVNHIDECKTNNVLTNLEWCTSKENCNHGERNHAISEKVSNPLICIETKEVFRNQFEACIQLGIDEPDLSNHLNKKGRNHIHGNHFVRLDKYGFTIDTLTLESIDYIVSSELSQICNQPKRRRGKILCVETGVIYKSQMEAARQTGIWQPTIGAALSGQQKQAGGYTWKRLEDI